MVFGRENENISKIVKIYGEILDTKVCNAEIKAKISQSLKILGNNQYVS